MASTYSIYNILVENSLTFAKGTTQGYVVAVNSNGSTYFAPLPSTSFNFIQGGNSYGATAIFGTNDNYNLLIKSNNTPAIIVFTTSNVSIGGTAADSGNKLYVNGNSLFNGNITPNTNGLFNLGSSALYFNQGYINNINANGAIISYTTTPELSNLYVQSARSGTNTSNSDFVIPSSSTTWYKVAIGGNGSPTIPTGVNAANTIFKPIWWSLATQSIYDTIANVMIKSGSGITNIGTITGTAGATISNASSLYIQGAPKLTIGGTISNPYSLYVAADNSYFGGDIITRNITPNANNTYNSGSITSAWNTVYSSQYYLGTNQAIYTTSNHLNFKSITGTDILLNPGGTTTARFFASGNTLIQNGATSTDNGYLLQVVGTATNGPININGKLIIDLNGVSTFGNHIYSGGDVRLGSTSDLYWVNKSRILVRNDNVIQMANQASNDFDQLQFGGSTAQYTSLVNQAGFKSFGNTVSVSFNGNTTFATLATSSNPNLKIGDIVSFSPSANIPQFNGQSTNSNNFYYVSAITGLTVSFSFILGSSSVTFGQTLSATMLKEPYLATQLADKSSHVGLIVKNLIVYDNNASNSYVKLGKGGDATNGSTGFLVINPGSNIMTLNNNAGSIGIKFESNTGTIAGAAASRISGVSGGLIFSGDGGTTQHISLNTTGNLLIGTASDPGYKLQIVGTATNGPLNVNNNLIIDANGNVGINSAPNSISKLFVSGFIEASSGFKSNSATILDVSGNVTRINAASGMLAYQVSTNGVIREYIDSTGNVGIGTTTPIAKLNVYGTGSTDLFRVDLGTISTPFYIGTGGNIGIGITGPVAILDVRGSQTATNSIARGIYTSASFSAVANNDILIGLDVAPTYNIGAFTGVRRYAARFTTPTIAAIAVSSNQAYIGESADVSWSARMTLQTFETYNNNMSLNASGATNHSILFKTTTNASSVQTMQLYNTGNLVLQNGGVFTDNGYRLQVNGLTGAASGAVYITGLSNSTLLRIDNDTTTYLLTVNGQGLLQFGGTNSSFPALKRSTTTLQARLADDSGYASLDSSFYLISGNTALNTSGASLQLAASGAYTNLNILKRTLINLNPISSTIGSLNIGAAAFDGSTTGFFTGSNAGTSIAINEASGYIGNFIDLQIAGTSKFYIDYTGRVSSAGSFLSIGNLQAGSAQIIYFVNRTKLTSPSDGNLLIQNFAQTDFNLLQFGGTSSSFPALKRTGSILSVKLADDSAYTGLSASTIYSSLVQSTTVRANTLGITGSVVISGTTSASTLISIEGVSGQLFSVIDSMTGSIFNVNDMSGVPVLTVDSSYTTTNKSLFKTTTLNIQGLTGGGNNRNLIIDDNGLVSATVSTAASNNLAIAYAIALG